jgi:uncharacterized protein YecT (DUF1311 family)
MKNRRAPLWRRRFFYVACPPLYSAVSEYYPRIDMVKMKRVVAVMAGLVLSSMAHAVPQSTPSKPFPAGISGVDPQTPWYQECLRVAKVKTPATPPAPAASCKGAGYYDKIDQANVSDAEWARVRACAVADNDDDVMAMLYANGLGVPRNLDIATQYACRAGGALMEMKYRIAHLQELRTAPAARRYDQCDDATSGYLMGFCATYAEQRADKVANAYLERLRRQLPSTQVAAFDQLVAATQAFAKARGTEMDEQGTIAAARMVQAVSTEKEWLREHLLAFEKGNVKLAAPAQLPTADAELNRAYKAVMATPSTDKDKPDAVGDSSVTKADVRAAQRLWLKYRDAWVRFAALRYPAMPADALKATLTQWRAAQLDKI